MRTWTAKAVNPVALRRGWWFDKRIHLEQKNVVALKTTNSSFADYRPVSVFVSTYTAENIALLHFFHIFLYAFQWNSNDFRKLFLRHIRIFLQFSDNFLLICSHLCSNVYSHLFVLFAKWIVFMRFSLRSSTCRGVSESAVKIPIFSEISAMRLIDFDVILNGGV